MADAVEIAFRRAAKGLVPEGASIVVAVSGGGDSIALLRLLHAMAPRSGWHLCVAHLDHGLRRGSRADRLFVEDAAAQLGWPCASDRRPVAPARTRDESLEEAARRVRRAFLLEVREARGAQVVATGHTLDDQAETILMRLARGAGPRALTGMAAAGPGPFVRPLLGLARAELRAWLERRGIAFRDDPSNRDLRFDRNRVRRLVLPVLAQALNPEAARHLVQAADRLREDAAWLDLEATAIFDRMVAVEPDATIAFQAGDLARLPAPLAGRIARIALERGGCDPRRITLRHVTALLALARGAGRGRAALPSGREAVRERGRLAVGPRRRPC